MSLTAQCLPVIGEIAITFAKTIGVISLDIEFTDVLN